MEPEDIASRLEFIGKSEEMATAISKELVQVSVSSDFENLRAEIVRNVVTEAFYDDKTLNVHQRLHLATLVMINLAACIETMADQLAEVAE